jgi:hypothetical protein
MTAARAAVPCTGKSGVLTFVRMTADGVTAA